MDSFLQILFLPIIIYVPALAFNQGMWNSESFSVKINLFHEIGL